MSTGRHIYPLRFHIEDTDCTGIVFHANYLKFVERARSDWLRSLGMGVEWQNKNQIFFVVHSAQLKYLKPGRVHEDVEVVSAVKKINAASLVMDQYLRETKDDSKILFKAEIKIACVGHDLRPCALPDLNQVRRLMT